MSNAPTSLSRSRKRFMAAAASVALAGAIGIGAVAGGTAPVFAEAVRVEAPQAPGFADVVSQVSPAVVSVQVKAKIAPASDRGDSPFSDQQGFDNLPDNHPLKRFFRQFGEDGTQNRAPRSNRGDRGQMKPRPVAQGSGFFISEDGYLVTNNHVVEDGSAYTVVTDDGKEYDAKLIGTDPRTDLAVLKVEADTKFTYVGFADDAKVRVGDWVVAVGNPFGLGGTVTAGIVSARGRDIGAGPYDDFLQIDAAVNRGNSGGPAFNLNGEVVGINTAIFSPSGGNVGIAFAIPASTAKQVVQDLMKSGSVQRGWLGVEIQPVTSDIAESLGLKSEKGALVASAQDTGPAKKAGIVAGDIITGVDGQDVASPKELSRLIAGITPGKSVDITVWRNGKAETVKVGLGEIPGGDNQASADQSAEPGEPTSLADLGLTVTPSEDGKGLVVTDVDPSSDAADRGIQAGDVITSVNSVEVKGPADVSAAIEQAAKAGRKAVLFQISREDTNRFVALPVGQG
ncbi:putative periplasmic serine endoprotease DegP-like precursor [Aminobacter sp. MSH1]|uniref:Do family serine endopeptidase n=1 Tax=Aminobacter sp. MSH1 TaxID=374606 RepID=UPI000D3373CC|nr:Do family serine endopeptidase [Aminobacter sp. MSH1]AWC24909.1 putative periplasmic serine endoprotease DegP-like precursor [Aminobacter sp. MSH1]